MRKLNLIALAFCITGSLLAQVKSPRQPSPEAASAAPREMNATTLPVKRVVLYKNGVGYFEHSGRVRGNQEVSIAFTTAQLNDVLKSLTAVDLGGGRITGVRYNSIAPLSERLKTLQIPLGEELSSAGFLGALRGTRVEVHSGATIALGKILSVEKAQKETAKGSTFEVTQVAIVTDAGELRSFEVSPGTSVRLVDGEIRQDVSRYLNLLGSMRSKDVRRMTISATGAGDRDLFVSYISEVPVWKSTYRIVIPRTPGTPFLQGWAIVDNTVGEDWTDVHLSLVSGAPQSFIQNISQPYYTRRPVVELPQSVMLTPQEHEASMNEPPPPPAPVGVPGMVGGGVGGGVGSGSGPGVGPGRGGGMGGGVFRTDAAYLPALSGRITDPTGAVVPNAEVVIRNENSGAIQTARTDNSGRYAFSGLAAGLSSLTISSPGFKTTRRTGIYIGPGSNPEISVALSLGAASETIEVTGADTSMNTILTAALRDQAAGAEGGTLGELFEYALKQKITVLKNQSALVPIVQSPIEAEKVTLVTAGESGNVDGAPLRALWLRNTSGLTLDGGTFNVLEEDSFAGEGIMDVLHPGERRLLSYAADTALRVTTMDESESGAVTHIQILKGIMKVTRKQRRTRTYTLHNADTKAREVIIEHPIGENWKLADTVKPEESSASHHRFRVKLDPGKTATLSIREFRPDFTSIYLTTLTDTQLAAYVQEKTITPATEEALRRVLNKKNEISAVDQDMRVRQQEIDSIDRDQARLRENMKALKGSAEERALLQRYTRQLDSQEDRISALRQQLATLKDRRAQLQTELDRMVQEVAVDETI